jgi:uncharacterized repeat protein (TIGR02543 family)
VSSQVYAAYGLGAAETVTIVVEADKAGNEVTVATLNLNDAKDTYLLDSTEIEAPFMNNFDSIPTYSTYGVIVYSGKNKVNPRLGLVKSGFTLDDIKAYVSENTGTKITNHSSITVVATDGAKADLSSFDDVTRYYYPSFLKDGKLMGTNFDTATRSVVPIVFALLNYTQQDVPAMTDMQLNDKIESTKAKLTNETSLRFYFGQAHGNNIEENLGSLSMYNIKTIRFSSFFNIKTERGLKIATGDGYLKAAVGENVKFKLANMSVKVNDAVVKNDVDKVIPLTFTSSTGYYSFTMPEGAVTVSTVQPAVKLTYNANGCKLSKSSKSVTAGNVYGTLPTPKKTNQTFLGWFTAKTGGSKVTAKTIVPRKTDHTLYAHYGANARVSLAVKTAKIKGKPASSSKTLKTLKTGASLVILGTSGKYYKVSVSGKTGYILKSSIYKLHQAKTKSKLVLRKVAMSSSSKVTTLKKGCTVTLIGKKGSWYLIQTGGKKGYIPTKSVKIID